MSMPCFFRTPATVGLLVVSALVPLSPDAALAGDAGSGYYQGQLRSIRESAVDVGVSLCIDGAAVSGSYFYLRVGTEIGLRGTRSPDGMLRLEESLRDGKVTGTWSGRVDGTFKGTWTSPSGEIRDFDLPRFGAIPAESSFPPPKGSTVRPCGEVGYRMRRAPKGRTDYFPRLVRFRDRKVTSAVNATIDEFVRGWYVDLESDGRSWCDEAAEPFYDVSVGVEYASHDVFSVRVTGEHSCGGPYPAHIRDDSFTFDLVRGGTAVAIDELFKPGVSWAEIFPVVFAYQLAEAAKPGADECLRQYNPEHLGATQVAFHFSQEGLVVGPSRYGLQSAVNGCEQRTTVPYRALRGLVDAASAIGRAAAAERADTPVRYRIWDFSPEKEAFFEPARGR
jgi:hypothetical protein